VTAPELILPAQVCTTITRVVTRRAAVLPLIPTTVPITVARPRADESSPLTPPTDSLAPKTTLTVVAEPRACDASSSVATNGLISRPTTPSAQPILASSQEKEGLLYQICTSYLADGEYQQAIIALRDGGVVAPMFQRTKVNPALCVVLDEGIIYVSGRAWIPNDSALRLKIFHNCYLSPSTSHPSRASTLDLLRRSFYWLRISEDVTRLLYNCQVYRTSKAVRQREHGLLNPLPIPNDR
jgi:hypothetical protein